MKKDNMITELLDGLDTLRPIVLAKDEQNAELRSLFRRLVSLLDTLQNTPNIAPSLYQHLLTLLALLFDAEHGTLLKRLHNSTDQAELLKAFKTHSNERKILIDAAQQDLPSALSTVRRGFDLLGKPHPETDNLNTNFHQFEKYLRLYLQGNSKVRLEFNLLTSAFNKSIKTMDEVLDDIGSSSPELKDVQKLLAEDLPQDPEQAQVLLRQARNNILKAGEKLDQASQQVKQTMVDQVTAMNVLSKRLAHAEEQARNDPLTGLGNRRKLREYFAELSAYTSSSFLMIDIDHFKHINDQYGHNSGDIVLKRLGEMLKVAIRSTDMAARLGGEEFCIVLPETTLTQAASLAEKIRQEVALETFQTQQGNIEVKISIGVAEHRVNESIAQWLKRADEALYQAKNNGRNRVVSAQ